MPFKEGFTLGPFSVDADGRLSPIHPDSVPGFTVRWRGRVTHARLSATEGDGGILALQADLGRIPSTFPDPARRAACFSALRGVMRDIPATWTGGMRPDHQPRLEVKTEITLPVTAADLVTELTAFLLELAPWLDLMDAAGIQAGA